MISDTPIQISQRRCFSKFQFDREFEGHRFVSRRLLCVTLNKQVDYYHLYRFKKKQNLEVFKIYVNYLSNFNPIFQL